MEVPRESHAEFARPSSRPDPLSLLESQSAARVPELLPVRYGRMAVSPFTYFRAAALPMASDPADSPRTGLVVQACGDAHLANFGLFASPERRLVFDINDFDETAPGPWEWDVKRLVASFAVAGRAQGLTEQQREPVIGAAGRSYRKAMRRFAAMGGLALWYTRADLESLLRRPPRRLSADRHRAIARTVAKARSRTSLRAAAKLTREVDGQRQIVSDPRR